MLRGLCVLLLAPWAALCAVRVVGTGEVCMMCLSGPPGPALLMKYFREKKGRTVSGVGKGEGTKVGEGRDKKGGKGRSGRKRERGVFTQLTIGNKAIHCVKNIEKNPLVICRNIICVTGFVKIAHEPIAIYLEVSNAYCNPAYNFISKVLKRQESMKYEMLN